MGHQWFTLDDQFMPDTLILGYTSFIWTERYSAAGEFQIVTKSTFENRQLLVPDTYIGMAGSTYTMKIDTVSDDTDSNGVRSLTVIGKSLEALLDDRVAMPGVDDLATTPNWVLTGLPGDIARELFSRICYETVIDDHDTVPFYTPGTYLPEGNLGESQELITVTVSPDTLYNVLKQLCDTYSLGFRFVRAQTQQIGSGSTTGAGFVSMGKMRLHATGSGVTGGTSAPLTHIGAVGGPDGASGETQAQFVDAQTQIGPGSMIKLFYNNKLNLWSQPSSSGVTPSAAIAAYPNVIPVLCWNDSMTQAEMTAFVNSVPSGQTVILAWRQEAENDPAFANGGQFLNGVSGNTLLAGWNDQANKIRTTGNSNIKTAVCSTWGRYMPTGNAIDGSWLPARNLTDFYFMDIYQHQAGGFQNGATTWPTNGLANHSGFQKWASLVKALNGVMGITEYGVDDTGTIAARQARIQLDYNYIRSAFNGGALSPFPCYCLIYWWHNMAASNTQYKFTDTATKNAWLAMVAQVNSGG